jgi:hypothetical protein
VADGNAYLVTVNKKLYGNFKTDIDVSKLNLESL